MHWLDIILLILFILAALWGAKSGFVKKVARIVALVLGIYLSVNYHQPVAGVLRSRFEGFSDFGATATSFVVIFLTVAIACWLIASWLSKVLEAAHLKPLDHLLGACLGLLIVAMFAGFILSGVVSMMGNRLPGAIAESKFAPVVLKGMNYVSAAVPDEWKSRFGKSLDEAKKAVQQEASEEIKNKVGEQEPSEPLDPRERKALKDPIPPVPVTDSREEN